MPTCHHWGAPDGADCKKISTSLVYTDSNGHSYCLLHAPKHYVGPKGFFLGEKESYGSRSRSTSKDEFDAHLKQLIDNQSANSFIRFDNIYFPKNFNYSLNQYDYPSKIFSFNKCHNISSFSNSKLKGIRMHGCHLTRLSAHSLKTEEFSISFSHIEGEALIRDSYIDTLSINYTTFESALRIKNIKEHTNNNHYKCSFYFNEVTFNRDVEVGNIEFKNENSEFRVVNSMFERNFYYHDNKLNDVINFEYCKFNNGKAYLENIDARKIALSKVNLEYMSFSNCDFPERFLDIEKESVRKAEEIYRELKRIASEQKDYNLLSKWHYLEKEMLLKRQKEQKNYFIYFILILYRTLSGYGEKPSQAIYSLLIYFLIVIFSLILIGVIHTGIRTSIDWEMARSMVYSLKDFIPFFITPSNESLLLSVQSSWTLKMLYNVIAAFGRIFCVIQIALFSLSIRNKMQR